MASGESKLFSYPTVEDPCILVRQNNGDLVADSQVCTHLSCAVVRNEKENVLFCPCHHSYFNLRKASILREKGLALDRITPDQGQIELTKYLKIAINRPESRLTELTRTAIFV